MDNQCVAYSVDWLVGQTVGWSCSFGRSVIGSIVWCAACLFGGLVGLLVVCVSHSVDRSVIESFGRSVGWCLAGWWVGGLVVVQVFGQWVDWLLCP